MEVDVPKPRHRSSPRLWPSAIRLPNQKPVDQLSRSKIALGLKEKLRTPWPQQHLVALLTVRIHEGDQLAPWGLVFAGPVVGPIDDGKQARHKNHQLQCMRLEPGLQHRSISARGAINIQAA